MVNIPLYNPGFFFVKLYKLQTHCFHRLAPKICRIYPKLMSSKQISNLNPHKYLYASSADCGCKESRGKKIPVII